MLDSRESGADRFKEAFVAYRTALEEHTRKRVPLRWAETKLNPTLVELVFADYPLTIWSVP